jgi:Icc protein
MSETKVLIQLSDLHIAGAGDLYGNIDSLDNVAAIFEVLEDEGRIDALILTGDLADDAEPAAYARLRSIVEPFVDKLGVPVMYLPGNHDRRGPFRSSLLDLEASDDNSDQVLWCGGVRIIGLDSTALDGHYGELDEAQLVWLANELERPAPLGTIVALHHPPIPGPIAAVNLMGLQEPERLAAVIADRDVKMVLAGHTHHATGGVLGGVPVWVATATAFQIDVPASDLGFLRGIPGSGYTRIDVSESGAVATHIGMLVRDRQLFNVDLELLRRGIAGELSEEEVHAAFAHAAADA